MVVALCAEIHIRVIFVRKRVARREEVIVRRVEWIAELRRISGHLVWIMANHADDAYIRVSFGERLVF